MPLPAAQIIEEVSACIACNECLVVCPALAERLPIETLNRETLQGPSSASVVRFARACYQCGACVPVCPVGLHRDAMMLWLKARLLLDARAQQSQTSAPPRATQPMPPMPPMPPTAGARRRLEVVKGRPHAR
jgi:ferredoxin